MAWESLVGGVEFSNAADERVVLRYSIDALIRLEDHLGIDVQGIMDMAQGGRLRDLRTLFWGGLTDWRPDITEAQASELMTEVTFARAGALMTEALLKAFPEAKADNGKARPRPAAANAKPGTGKNSTPPGPA